MTIRVVVAEDNLLMRQGVCRVLERSGDVEIVGECDGYEALLDMVDQHGPDVVVTDIRMPPTGTDEGIRAANELRSTHPSTGVVVLSQFVSPAYALALLAEGSDRRAYLLKDRVADSDELAQAVRAVADGRSVIDPAVVDELVRARSRSRRSPLDFLTQREHEILAAMAQGQSNAAIGASLGLSERAVEKHINSLFAKLNLGPEPDINRRVKAVLMFLHGGGVADPTPR